MPTVGSPRRYAIDVFVASLTPVTLTYYLNATSVPSITRLNPVAACIGDTLVLDKVSSITSAATIAVVCFPRGVISYDKVVLKVNGAAPVSWIVDSGAGDSQCLVGLDVGFGQLEAAIITVYPRPTATTATPISWSEFGCANCTAGYRSSRGAQSCTRCGVGYYSSDVAETCIACPVGTMCPVDNTTLAVDCGPGFYQPQTGQSFCLSCPAGKYCELQRTTDPQNCTAGNFSGSGASACIKCQAGFISNDGAPACKGIPTVGPAEVIQCPVGYYGLDPECNPCPANTNSSVNHTLTLLDCRCVAGYVCTYKKRISVVLTLHNITWDMKTYVGLSQSSIIDAIAQAAGVSRENVIINPMFSGRRRLFNLNSARHVMFITVHGAEKLDVERVYSILNVSSHITWAHSHSVHVARELS